MRQEGNGHRCDGFSVLVKDRITDIYNAMHLITRQLFVTTPANLGEMAGEPSGNWFPGAASPYMERVGADLIALKSKDDMPRSRIQEIDIGS